jgi:hypothetical protein
MVVQNASNDEKVLSHHIIIYDIKQVASSEKFACITDTAKQIMFLNFYRFIGLKP